MVDGYVRQMQDSQVKMDERLADYRLDTTEARNVVFLSKNFRSSAQTGAKVIKDLLYRYIGSI
jgi:hypothetical protein